MYFSQTIGPFDRMIIESNIRRAADRAGRQAAGAAWRAADAAADRMESAINDSTSKIRDDVAEIRIDMLESSISLRQTVKQMGRQIGNGLYQIEATMMRQSVQLTAIYGSIDLNRRNMIEGFNAIIDKLEAIQYTLGRIERGVMNPEETRALERYRRARTFISHGRIGDAIDAVEAGMNNDGGPSLAHMPELRILRGTIRLGLYDTDTQVHSNLAGAVQDFEEALVFADAKAKPQIREHIALAHWGMQNYPAAFAAYEALGNHIEARYQAGRCLLQIGRHDHARDIFKEIIEKSPKHLAIAAADPICRQHGSIFIDITRSMRREQQQRIHRAEIDRKARHDELARALENVFEFSPIKTMRRAKLEWIEAYEILWAFRGPVATVSERLAREFNRPNLEISLLLFNGDFNKAKEKVTDLEREIYASIKTGSGVEGAYKACHTDSENRVESQKIISRLRNLTGFYGRIEAEIGEMIHNFDTTDGIPELFKSRVVENLPHPTQEMFMPKRPNGLIGRIRHDNNYQKLWENAEKEREREGLRQREVRSSAREEVRKLTEAEALPRVREKINGLSRHVDRARKAQEAVDLTINRIEKIESRYR